MLALYRIPDDVSDEEVEQRRFPVWEYRMGSFDLPEYRGLSCVFMNGEINVPYFQDSRLYSWQVRRLLEICRQCQLKQQAAGNTGNYIYKQLLAMLAAPVSMGQGLLALCD